MAVGDRREFAHAIAGRAFCHCDLDGHSAYADSGIEISKRGWFDVLNFQGIGVMQTQRRRTSIRDYTGASEQRIVRRQSETMPPIELEGDIAFDEGMRGEHVEVTEVAL